VVQEVLSQVPITGVAIGDRGAAFEEAGTLRALGHPRFSVERRRPPAQPRLRAGKRPGHSHQGHRPTD
jgi:hypothetical protein